VDRTEASIAPARGGDRTDRRHRCRVPTGRTLAALVIVGLCIGNAWVAPGAEGAGAAKPSHRTGSSGPALTLLAPPTIAGPASPFALRLGVSPTVPRADLSLRLTVYSALRYPTEFDETLSGSPVGTVIAPSGAIPVATLPADTVDPKGGVDLSVPVKAGGVAGTGTGPFTAVIDCPLGSCGGVYPVRIDLSDTTSGTDSRLLTYLVYTGPSDIEPLRFALVVPLALASSSPSSGSAGAVTSSSLTTLTGVLDALSGTRTTVPLTLAPSPATVAALDGDRQARSKAALATLVALAGEPGRQTLCGSFVPVDASALVAAAPGGTELTEQLRRGTQVLTAVPGLAPGGCTTGNAWVAGATLDPAALGDLGALGYDDVVVPPGAVAGPPPSTTPTRRFTLTGAPTSGSAILSDPSLTALLQSTSRTDPALAADQLLAELELYYYEAPNTSTARGVVAAPPADGHVNTAVLTDVLAGLQGNPMIQPVTLATLFSDVPVGGDVGGVSQPAGGAASTPRAVGVFGAS